MTQDSAEVADAYRAMARATTARALANGTIDDATATTARMLCSDERDLATPEGWASAIRSYNQSEQYLRDVRDAAANYALNQPA